MKQAQISSSVIRYIFTVWNFHLLFRGGLTRAPKFSYKIFQSSKSLNVIIFKESIDFKSGKQGAENLHTFSEGSELIWDL